MNICSRHDVSIWNLQRINIDEIYVNISIKDFRKLRLISRKTKCKLSIKTKNGFPFFINKFRYRYALWIGIALLLYMYYVSTYYIWSIDIAGVSNVSEGSVMRLLEQNDIYIGAKVSDIDTTAVKNDIMSKLDDISFIAINIIGNQIVVDIEENIKKPNIFDEYSIRSIVSDKTGVLHEMIVRAGEPQKKVGETVLSGDVLISGIVNSESEDKNPTYTHSTADIKIRTWYNGEMNRPLIRYKKLYDKEPIKRYAIVFDGRRINLYSNRKNLDVGYDKTVHKNIIKINKSFVFPISIVVENYYKYQIVDEPIKLSEIKQQLELNAISYIKSIIDGEIVSINFSISEIDNMAILKYSAECLEDTGIEVEQDIPIIDDTATDDS